MVPEAEGAGSIGATPIQVQGDETTLTWNPMGQTTPNWGGPVTLTATKVVKKQLILGIQTSLPLQPYGDYVLANVLAGKSFDVTDNTDVQKALGAIITALGGIATNVPTT